jgi:hypothetical protein
VKVTLENHTFEFSKESLVEIIERFEVDTLAAIFLFQKAFSDKNFYNLA